MTQSSLPGVPTPRPRDLRLARLLDALRRLDRRRDTYGHEEDYLRVVIRHQADHCGVDHRPLIAAIESYR
jgi:hypothetical protein